MSDEADMDRGFIGEFSADRTMSDLRAENERLRNRLNNSTMPVPNMQELHDLATDNATLRQRIARRITLGWLRPFVQSLPKNAEIPQWHWLNSKVFLYCDEHGRWTACTPDGEPSAWHEICELKTRSDVSRLCRLLKVRMRTRANQEQ